MLTKVLSFTMLLALLAAPATAQVELEPLLARAAARLSAMSDELSNVSCTEVVTQTRLDRNNKVLAASESEFDYLLMLTADANSLTLEESRLPKNGAGGAKPKLMASNGFATLFLIFHPYYQSSYAFTLQGTEQAQGRMLARVAFAPRSGGRTPAILFLRGREYPLELSGTALLEMDTGNVVRMNATLAHELGDLGIRSLELEVEYAPVPLRGVAANLRFATAARVELATEKQRWRNLHRFSKYLQFSTGIDEKVKEPESQ